MSNSNVATRLKILTLSGISAIALLGGAGLTHRTIILPLNDGGLVRITPPSFWAALYGSTCQITYKPKGRSGGSIVLLNTWLEAPILVVPSADSNVLFCLYDFDVDLRLLRIDTTASFQPPALGSALSEIVLNSPWRITEATAEEWRLMSDHLSRLPPSTFQHQAPPNIDLGLLRTYRDLVIISQRVIARTKNVTESQQSSQKKGESRDVKDDVW